LISIHFWAVVPNFLLLQNTEHIVYSTTPEGELTCGLKRVRT